MSNPRPIPEGAYTASQVGGLQSITADSWKAQLAQETAAPFERARQSGLDTWIANIGAALAGNPPAGFEPVRDGQMALTNQVELLSPLLDYGSVYMNTIGGFKDFGENDGIMPFDQQIGPMRNLELFEDGLRLKAAGLWNITAQLAVDNNALNVGSGRLDWRVVVLAPDGSIFSQTRGFEERVYRLTTVIVSSVVVPAPDYVVKVVIDWIHGSRKLLGGPDYNRLTVQHISNEVNVGNTGGEASDAPTEPPEPEPDPDPDPPPA